MDTIKKSVTYRKEAMSLLETIFDLYMSRAISHCFKRNNYDFTQTYLYILTRELKKIKHRRQFYKPLDLFDKYLLQEVANLGINIDRYCKPWLRSTVDEQNRVVKWLLK